MQTTLAGCLLFIYEKRLHSLQYCKFHQLCPASKINKQKTPMFSSNVQYRFVELKQCLPFTHRLVNSLEERTKTNPRTTTQQSSLWWLSFDLLFDEYSDEYCGSQSKLTQCSLLLTYTHWVVCVILRFLRFASFVNCKFVHFSHSLLFNCHTISSWEVFVIF